MEDWSVVRERAATAFSDGGAALTPLREHILRALHAADAPVGAYDLADQVRNADGKPLPPNTIYRVLMLLQRLGLVRRIESRHAYVVAGNDPAGLEMFLLCDGCGQATALTDMGMLTLLDARTQALGFRPSHRIVELTGRCRACDGAPAGGSDDA